MILTEWSLRFKGPVKLAKVLATVPYKSVEHHCYQKLVRQREVFTESVHKELSRHMCGTQEYTFDLSTDGDILFKTLKLWYEERDVDRTTFIYEVI